MIFGHAPLGIALAYVLRKKWVVGLERREQFILYLFAVAGALAPDVDLIFYYFYAANFWHHEIFTHGIIIWLILGAAMYVIGKWKNHKILRKGAGLFILGTLTHLLADSLGAGVAWFAPFSAQLYGLTDWPWFADLWANYAFIINYGLELLCWLSFVVILCHYFIRHKKTRLILVGISIFLCGIFIGCLFYINTHLFHYPGEVFYNDVDRDGIVNLHDLDQDGDGIININDVDINGNGTTNKIELYQNTQMQLGVWYDFTHGGWFEVPLRLGLTTDTDLIVRIYNSLGIFIKEEMQQDQKINPEDYRNLNYPGFERNIVNWQAWLKHINAIIKYSKDTKLATGDILFMEDNTVALVAGSEHDPDILEQMRQKIIAETIPENFYYIILASKEKGMVIGSNDYLLNKQHGAIKFIGRILKD